MLDQDRGLEDGDERATTTGSNWEPACDRSSSRAASGPSAAR